MIIDIYRLYSEKSIRKNRILKYACIFSVILAVGIIFSMQVILDVYKNNVSDRIKSMNGLNVKILDRDYLEHQFNEEQLEILEKTMGKYNYTLAYCDNSNIVSDGKDDTVAMTVFNQSDIISAFGIKSLNDGEVVISNNVAKRLNICIGDEIFVKLHSTNYVDNIFKVVQIVNDNVYFSAAGSEYEIAQETLGCIYLVLPDFDKFNTAYFDNMDETVLNLLEENFSPFFEIRTLQQLTEIVLPRIQLQIGILKLVASVAMIISNICLVWSFLIFIMDRRKDFLIFKKIGIRTIDLSKLLLVEIYAVVIRGILLGIPLGGLIATVYLQINGGLEGLTVLLFCKNVAVSILVILIETTVFSLIPISRINKIINQNNLVMSSNTPMLIIVMVSITMMIMSCVYVKSFMGIAFFTLIGIVFGIFYLILIILIKLVTKIIAHNKNINFLFINDMKRESKITSFSLNIVDVCMVIVLILLSVLPMIYSPIENGTNPEGENISYRTIQKKAKAEEILKENSIEYYQFYEGEIKLLQINGVDVEHYMNQNIAEIYRKESIEEISNRKIDVYEDEHTPPNWQDKDGIYINNIYKNIIDFKENDLLTILVNDSIINCKIAGVYEDTNSKDTIGIVSESYMELQGEDIRNSNMPVVYTLTGNISNDVLSEILFDDENAYIDRNQQLSDYLKKYINQQKAILVNIIMAVGFSSILLVFLGQIILFVRKKDYYIALWKIGMSKQDLISGLLLEKFLLGIIQVLVITIFLEPIRFLINAETSLEKYSISVQLLLIEFIIILVINLSSVIFPFLLNRKK